MSKKKEEDSKAKYVAPSTEQVEECIDNSGKSDRELLEQIQVLTQKAAILMEKSKIREYTELMQSPKRIIFTNVLAGIGRGVGIAIGLSVITALLVYFLQLLGALNLPIIGDFIADIVEIVQNQLDSKRY